MIERSECYKILGIKEGSSKYEIMKSYNVLIKRARSMNSKDKSELKPDMETMNKAYNILMGYDTGEDSDAKKYKPNPLLKKLGIDQRKASNFIYYYKFHMIGAALLLVLAIFFVKDVVFRVPSELDIAFVGNIYYENTEILKEEIMVKMPDIKEMTIDGVMLSGSNDSQMEYAMNMKAMMIFGAGTVDLFILDKESYVRYAEQGAFEDLGPLAESLNIDSEKTKDLLVAIDENEEYEEPNETNENTEKQLYGIDITDSRILKEFGASGEQFIVSVRVNAKHHDNAIQLLKLLIE